jgi:hypothetical protein
MTVLGKGVVCHIFSYASLNPVDDAIRLSYVKQKLTVRLPSSLKHDIINTASHADTNKLAPKPSVSSEARQSG